MKRDIKKLHRILGELGLLVAKSKHINGTFNVEPFRLDVSTIRDNPNYHEYKYLYTEYNIHIRADEKEK